jgi:hypothetical protein
MADKNTIKNWFKTGLKPTQAQFWATWDSFWHKDEKIPITAIDDIENILNAKAEAEVLADHLANPASHGDLFSAKEDKTNKGIAGGYVPLNEFVKISSGFLDIVDDFVTGGSSAIASAETVKTLQTQINAINTLLTSNNVNLDNVQEIVDAIETAQASLSTILVNDLTTGGTTKALTAEMGKSLKILVDSLSTNKLEKGGYAGTAQQLKTEIDDIYQPDVLIRSVPPTRVGDTFTYPVGEYEYLLSKVHHVNAANFSVTIIAAPTDYKRTDLIYAKPDNSLAKLGGTESLTVAIRPDVPAGCVGISFINVFGATISEPTLVDTSISIQDSLGIEKFKITDYIRFRGASFNPSAKQIEIDPTVPLSVFLDVINGNDFTASLENSKKPYRTFNALINALPAFAGETYTIFITGGTVAITRKLAMRNLRFVAYTPTTLDFTAVKENDGITEAYEVFSNWTLATWTFENQNISIISNYVGQKSLSYSSQYGVIIKGSIDIFNWKSVNVLNSRGTVFEAGSDLTINRLYDSSQNTVIFSEPNNVNLVINTFYVQYRRALASGSSSTNGYTVYVKNIVGVGALSYPDLAMNCLSLKIGNISNYTGFFRPTSKTVEILGTIVDTCTIDFISCPLVTGTLKSNNYHTTSDLAFQQVFRNFIGKLTGFLAAVEGRVSFENCIINVKNELLTKGYWGVGYSYNSSIDDIVSFKGSNTIIQDSTTGNMLMNSNPTAALNLRTIQIDDYGTTKTNVTSFGKTVKYIPRASTFKEKTNEVVIRSKEDLLLRTLNSSTTYIIDGVITLLTGEYIEVPAGGLTIVGYGFDVSKINKNVSGQSIFTSPAGNSGNFVTRDIQYNSGVGTVFNITDSDGSHAMEFNDVNFQSCAALGTFNGYRQFTATTCGFYSCSDGFTLEGTWNSFKITNSNVIGFGASGTFIKKGASTLFNNRLYVDLNMSIATGSKICDFQDSNFASNKLLQVVNCLVKVNGVIDATTTGATFPNISPFSVKAYFTNNIGVKNSFNEPYGLKTTNLSTYASDSAAAIGNVQIGEVYIETATGYFKTRLV